MHSAMALRAQLEEKMEVLKEFHGLSVMEPEFLFEALRQVLGQGNWTYLIELISFTKGGRIWETSCRLLPPMTVVEDTGRSREKGSHRRRVKSQ